MKVRSIRVGRFAALAAIVWIAAGCGEAASEGGRSRGVVEAVDATARTVTLDHEEVPGLMAAMTMQFEVAPDVDLDGLASGSEVEFWVVENGGRYTVTRIRRDGT